MKFIDLFSGIGGFRSALELNGHKCIAYSEVDKFAKQSYQAIYNTEDEIDLGDITKISEEYLSHFKQENDIVVGGSPCQSFSLAGSRKGFEDTRGTLFFEYAKVVKETQPKYFLFENVKGMLSHDKGNTIRVVLETFDQLGYYIDFNVFNSKYYDVPQNRERIYIVGKRKDLVDNPKYQEKVKGKKKLEEVHNWAVDNINYVKLLPKLKTEVTTRLIDVLEDEVDEKYYLSEEKTKKLTLDNDLGGKLNMYDFNERDKVHSVNKVSPTLNTMQGGDRQPKIAVKGFKEVVKVRKYDVNKLELSELLRISKQDADISNKEISEKLNIPITKVEHWFRTDKSFAIPDASVWFELKQILNITNTDHDEAITTFISKESNFDTTNRIYDTNHLSPTLNTTSEPKVAVLGNTSHTGYKAHDVHDINGLSPTVAARDYKGPKQIAVREATKKGYAIAEQGDSVNVTYPDSKTRRGRVGKQVAQTLQAGEVNQGVVINSKICRRCNGKLEPSDLEDYEYVCFECDENFYEFETKDEVKAIIGSTQKNAYVGDGSTSPSLTSAMGQGGGHVPMPVYSNLRIRKLTPLECWRLQGFTDEQFYKAQNDGVSNSQLYKQAGNAVTVNVVDYIVKNIIKEQ